jgi:hypothetical protein
MNTPNTPDAAKRRSFVKITDSYAEEAKKYNCVQVVARFKTQAEGSHGYQHNNIDAYGFDENYLQKRHKNFRSIFTWRDFEIASTAVRCYVALRVFPRGSDEYAKFYQGSTSSNVRNNLTGLNSINWDGYKNEIEKDLEDRSEIPPLPDLQDSEKALLDQDTGILYDIFDTPIYESKQWIDTVRSNEFGDPFKVAVALEDKIYKQLGIKGVVEIPYGDRGDAIIAYQFPEDEKHDSWFLLGLGNPETIKSIRGEIGENPDLNELKRKCRRAYPLSMLDDKDFWSEMEKDKDSNFILSEEEIGIVSKQQKFPLFISGRAGSGKSTVLQYLFAEYMFKFLINRNVKPPVYLSYSDNLIENAKRLARSLFEKNHAYTKKLNDKEKGIQIDLNKDVWPKFSETFFVFQNLLLDCIRKKNPNILTTRFQSSQKVTYAKYRELWHKKFGKAPKAIKEYGPALSWHVIRTYIKGWTSEGFLEIDDYEKIGRGNKSVSNDVFGLVFNKVWEGWYKEIQETEGFWDDQDLVRYCLAPDDDSCETYVVERFSAVLCDEAQDFTRTEIDFILRLSTFSRRRIYDKNTLFQLPFVFAGDEFQTLNPTGFSWDSLRSYFTERLIHSTELGETVGAPEPKVLTQNYRSTPPIVRLGNRLQLLRQTRFKSDTQVPPQIPYYNSDSSCAVYCLDYDKPAIWEKLSGMGVILIVPSADGQSIKDFIENSVIKERINFYDDGSPIGITIYNPLQAKGLDYPCVALFGFENTETPEFGLKKLKDWYLNPSEDKEAREIELKYFISNAYVSATRAKEKLFILSKFVKDSFWSFAFATSDGDLQKEIENIQALMLGKTSKPGEWCDENGVPMLGYVSEGEIGNITGENIVDAGEVARTTEARGMDLHDYSLMRQAAARYRERAKAKDVVRCEAWAYVFEMKYMEAARKFKEANLLNDAILNYWRAFDSKNGDEILLAVSMIESDRLEVRFAKDFLKSSITAREVKLNVDALVSLLSGNSKDLLRDYAFETKNMWQFAVGMITAKIKKIDSSDKTDIDVLIAKCEQLKQHGFTIDENFLALAAFKVGSYETAIRLWDSLYQNQNANKKPKEYHKAKTQILQYPDVLVHWPLTGDAEWEIHVEQAYHKNNDVSLDDEQKRTVGIAMLRYGERADIEKFLPWMLASCTVWQDGHGYVESAKRKNPQTSTECLDGLLRAKLNLLQDWKPEMASAKKRQGEACLNMLMKLRYVCTDQFRRELDTAFMNRQSRNFLNSEFSQFARTPWGELLLTQVGHIVERRGYFVDGLFYYGWAITQSHNEIFRREMTVRWIVCKEQQANNEKEDNRRNELKEEALAKRSELGIKEGDRLDVEGRFHRWESLFAEALKIIDTQEIQTGGNLSTEGEGRKDNKKQEITVEEIANEFKLDVSQAIKKINQKFDVLRSTIRDSQSVIPALYVEKIRNYFFKIKSPPPPGLPLPLPKGKPEFESAPPQEAGGTPVQPLPVIESAPLQKTVDTSVQPPPTISKIIFEYVINGYKFRFNPQKYELSISLLNDEEDRSIKIKNGVFPPDGEFSIRNTSLIFSDGNATPFGIVIDPKGILIKVIESNVEVLFPVASSH